MNKNLAIDISLWTLVILGLLGSAKVSFANMTGAACPYIWLIPVCYIVTAAYALMLGSLIIKHDGCKHYFFCAGWGVALIIALLASITEWVGNGGVCPSTSSGGLRGAAEGGIPLCYISLAMLVVILILFLKGPYGRACENHNKFT